MPTSLKAQLHEILKREGYLSLEQVHKIAADLGHKQATAERTLRRSLSPNVVAVRNAKSYITGYRWVDPATYEAPAPVMDSDTKYYFSDQYYLDKAKKENEPLNGQIPLL